MYHVGVNESMSERIHSTQPLPVIHFRANETPLSDQDNTASVLHRITLVMSSMLGNVVHRYNS